MVRYENLPELHYKLMSLSLLEVWNYIPGNAVGNMTNYQKYST